MTLIRLLVFLSLIPGAYQASSQSLVSTPWSLGFHMVADSNTLPAPQTIQITSPNGKVPFICYPNDYGKLPPDPFFVSITPASGTTPSTVTVNISSNVLPWGYGGYYNALSCAAPSGTPLWIPIALLVDLPPPPVVTSVVSAATLQPGISPGAIVTILGKNIGPGIPSAANAFESNGQIYYSAFVDTTKVTFNGYLAPLLYAATGQINAVVPYEVAGQTNVQMVVYHQFVAAAPLAAPIADTSPGLFTVTQDGNGQGAILNQDYTRNSAENPAPAGSIVQIFGTGAGLWDRTVVDGLEIRVDRPFPLVAAKVTVNIGGLPATVIYAGAAPTLISGALQVNAVVPAGLVPGPQPVVLTIGSSSNAQQHVTVAVK